jgi:hypothetical protein
MRFAALLSLLIICFFLNAGAQEFTPGKERWLVKTSVPGMHPVKHIALKELLNLPPPVTTLHKGELEEYQDQRFVNPVGNHQLKEGDLISTEGYILLVALEKNDKGADADYHVQIRTAPEWSDTCLIVEATWPPFILNDPVLRDSCRKVRDFFDDFILKGKKKTDFGSGDDPAPRVKITGQLFFDASHLNSPPRGKQNHHKQKMKSYTCWELHPIISIGFITGKK